ncbi:hypothetical protein NUU61_009366 [Penicillium alfredii]|uniref:Uncharacterized protein n=1 Tax=Penicillium alfredii TaxID=1506179 RepID=A0A9W9EN09_9EURO|nr:uncharacterized protein NUU61_009366 [Penicillium alfredii]KAJ5084787.1 hypothetical protein NUU61_009366 [Penicillium alfredii]
MDPNIPVAPALQSNRISHNIFVTRYVRMVVESDQIPWKHNVLASAAHWVLLAGYLVIPGTFTSLQKSDSLNGTLGSSEAGEVILKTIQNPPLLAMACVLFLLGSMAMGWLFWKYRDNYIWLLNRLFLPTLLNALAGLLTTFINIYTAHHGDWSIMALLTVIASGLSVASSSGLVIIYKFRKLEKVKQEHWQATSVRNRGL